MGIFPRFRLRRVVTALLLAPAFCAPSLRGAVPVVDSFVASPATVAPGGLVTLTVMVHDPDCVAGTCTTGCGAYLRADLTAWSDSVGPAPSYPQFLERRNGTSASPYSAEADWLAPVAEGVYSATVEISDSATTFCGGGRQTAQATVEIEVSAATSPPPVIDSVTSERSVVPPGGSSRATCAASDPQGEPLSITWQSDVGSITPDGDAAALFVAPPVPGIATITCTATDPSGLQASDTVQVAVSLALAERKLSQGLAAPRRLAADAAGRLFVADPRAGGIGVVDLATGAMAYRIPVPGVTAVAVDWNGNLLVGDGSGASVRDRDGETLMSLGEGRGAVSDVAVDEALGRYGVLYRDAGLVAVFDGDGSELLTFGNTATTPELFKRPLGLASAPGGSWVVADSSNEFVRVFDSAGGLIRSFGGPGAAIGKFVQLDDVVVDHEGRILASDAFQDWVQVFGPTGDLLEVFGTYGDEVGQFMTASGIAVAADFGLVVVASENSPSLQVFRAQDGLPAPPWPSALLAPGALGFGSIEVGATSAPQAVTLANNGAAIVGVGGISAGPGFVVGDDCGDYLDPGTSCAIEIRFAPNRSGSFAEELRVATSAQVAPLRTTLAGAAYVPARLVLSPGALAFPEQAVGTASDPQWVAVSNAGTQPLQLSGAWTEGDFALINPCPGILAGGTTCAVSVYFTPSVEADPLLGTLFVAPASGAAGGVALSGSSVLLEVTPDPPSLAFGLISPGLQDVPRSVTLTNSGSAAVELGASALVGPEAEEFLLVSDGCGGSALPPGGSCDLVVTFAPRAPGAVSASLRQPVGELSPLVIPLTGGADVLFADAFEIGDTRSWSVGTLDFGGIDLGFANGESVRWTNWSPIGVQLTAVTLTGDDSGAFWIVSDGCSGVYLPPLSHCDLALGFEPPSLGFFSGLVTAFSASGGQSFRRLELRGEGIGP